MSCGEDFPSDDALIESGPERWEEFLDIAINPRSYRDDDEQARLDEWDYADHERDFCLDN